MIASDVRSPFYFKVGDPTMDKKKSSHYFPPKSRKVMKDYLSKDTIRLEAGNFHNMMCKLFRYCLTS